MSVLLNVKRWLYFSSSPGNIMQKIDKMYAAFTGQPLEKVQQYTERDRFLSVSEVMFLVPLFFLDLFII